MQNYNYSLNDIDYMMPWEREIYIFMLLEDIKEKAEARNRWQQ
ncbi:hypothetical protein OAA37_00600 [bacterium]|jgi:hypothetical protein|nr:hypothetical protein [bacterium]MDB4347953.1 hypothetical protein [bacterium]MDB4350066.1 hypothetical protein [bacterium]